MPLTPTCRLVLCFNERMRRVHTEIIAPVARGSPRHRVYDLQGTLQAAAAIAGAPEKAALPRQIVDSPSKRSS